MINMFAFQFLIIIIIIVVVAIFAVVVVITMEISVWNALDSYSKLPRVLRCVSDRNQPCSLNGTQSLWQFSFPAECIYCNNMKLSILPTERTHRLTWGLKPRSCDS